MSNASPVAGLSPRTAFVLRIMTEAAAAGAETPRNTVIDEALRAAGFTTYARTHDGYTGNVVSYEIARLVKAGAIALHGGKRLRVIEVLATGQRTAPRAETMQAIKRQQVNASIRAATAGWPRPTRIGAASYDAAVAARAFAPETWVHLPVRAAAEARSVTGCSAAMAAEAV